MTQEQHPITPPPELVQQWHMEAMSGFRTSDIYRQDIATQAARWGADMELVACMNYVDNNVSGNRARALRAARRPKPPSLKERALEILKRLPIDPEAGYCPSELDTIRRALEALPD